MIMKNEENSQQQQQKMTIPIITYSSPDTDLNFPSQLSDQIIVPPPKFDSSEDETRPLAPTPTMFPIHEAIYGHGTAHIEQIKSPAMVSIEPPQIQLPSLTPQISPLPSPGNEICQSEPPPLTAADAEVIDISFFQLGPSYAQTEQKIQQTAEPLRQWQILHK